MNKNTPAPKAAIILRFPSKRGRPRSTRPSNDTGTPELVMKRLLGHTAEALDLCLDRELISPKQHWCGIHLRWLYTLRYGAPNIRAIDPTHLGGSTPKTDDPEWRSAREQEYSEAIKKLTKSGHALMLMNLCVYNERPQFLTLSPHEFSKNIHAISEMVAQLRDGLDILARLWKR